MSQRTFKRNHQGERTILLTYCVRPKTNSQEHKRALFGGVVKDLLFFSKNKSLPEKQENNRLEGKLPDDTIKTRAYPYILMMWYSEWPVCCFPLNALLLHHYQTLKGVSAV